MQLYTPKRPPRSVCLCYRLTQSGLFLPIRSQIRFPDSPREIHLPELSNKPIHTCVRTCKRVENPPECLWMGRTLQEGVKIPATAEHTLYCTEVSCIHVSQEKIDLIRKSNYDMAQFQESDQRESGLQAARPHTAHKTPQNGKPRSDWLALRNFHESVYVSFISLPENLFILTQSNITECVCSFIHEARGRSRAEKTFLLCTKAPAIAEWKQFYSDFIPRVRRDEHHGARVFIHTWSQRALSSRKGHS